MKKKKGVTRLENKRLEKGKITKGIGSVLDKLEPNKVGTENPKYRNLKTY